MTKVLDIGLAPLLRHEARGTREKGDNVSTVMHQEMHGWTQPMPIQAKFLIVKSIKPRIAEGSECFWIDGVSTIQDLY